MRTRVFGPLLLATTLAIGQPLTVGAATKTTKPSPSLRGTDRLLPDISDLPVAILVRRAARSRGPREIVGALRFLQPGLTPPEGEYALKGRIDFGRRVAELNLTIEGSLERYLYVGDAAYQKVDPASIDNVGGTWVRSSPGSGPMPAGAILMELTFAGPSMVASVETWKDVSTKADKQKGVRRLRGTGSLEAVSAYLSPDRFNDNVAVETLIDKQGFIAALKWRLEPLARAANTEPVEFLNTYAPAKSPLTVTAPDTDVVDYADVVSAQTPSN